MGGATAGAKKDGPAKAAFGSSFRSVFMHADAADVVLMVLGLVGAIGDGVSMPVMLFITSRIFNDLGGSGAEVLQEFSSKINEVRTHPQNSTFVPHRLICT
jgi:ATP-binding cassette subfamily B (MDR/TAP) protein 1